MAHAYRREGRAIGSDPKIWFVTGALTVHYRAPAPISRAFDVVAEIAEWSDSKTILHCKLRCGDVVCADSQVIAVRLRKDRYPD